MPKMTRVCQNCGIEFETWPNEIRRGKGKYCSLSCAASEGGRVMRAKYPLHSAKNHHLRKRAHKAVERNLEQQPCETCEALPTEAHHDDYAKPLEVHWLCSKHHYETHVQGSS